MFLLCVLLGPLFSIGLGTVASAESADGSAIRQACYIGIAVVLFIALKPWENYQRIMAIPMPLLIGLAYCWLSLTWAIEPAVALRRLILATIVMWTIFASMRQLRFEEVLFLSRFAMTVVLVCNFIAVAVAPDYAIHSGSEFGEYSLAGDWKGIMQHKNLAGAACALTLILFTFDRGRMPRWLQWGVMAAAAYFLYRTNSKTSFGLAIAGVAVGYLYMRYQRQFRGLLLIGMCVLAVGVTMIEGMYQNPLLGHLEDPKAFTGRTQIWQALFRYIGDHPWFGAGYGSFWHIGPSSPVFTYASGEVALIPSGHNGFLDVAVQIGIPGLILIIVVAIIFPVRRLLNSPIAKGQRGALLAALFLFCIGHNFTESSLFDRDLLVWVMLMIAMALSQPDLIRFQRAKFDVHNLIRFHAADGGRAAPSLSPRDG